MLILGILERLYCRIYDLKSRKKYYNLFIWLNIFMIFILNFNFIQIKCVQIYTIENNLMSLIPIGSSESTPSFYSLLFLFLNPPYGGFFLDSKTLFILFLLQLNTQLHFKNMHDQEIVWNL
ncbi:hypothetical protein A9G43_07270 [Gilliamella sp. Occ3-1]|nr:hypothetical protein A9G43_07270 [Gilliamella apicola]